MKIKAVLLGRYPILDWLWRPLTFRLSQHRLLATVPVEPFGSGLWTRRSTTTQRLRACVELVSYEHLDRLPSCSRMRCNASRAAARPSEVFNSQQRRCSSSRSTISLVAIVSENVSTEIPRHLAMSCRRDLVILLSPDMRPSHDPSAANRKR